ncbi:MAG: hypothetical protein M3P98_04540 [bacterium]|nr:hypothetical protein [bacterium]
MSESKFLVDVKRVVSAILDSTPPNKTWIICNIAKSKKELLNEQFTFYKYKDQIPLSFGYQYDETVDYLESIRVVEAYSKNDWFTRISHKKNINDLDDLDFEGGLDLITCVARAQNYISSLEYCKYFQDVYDDDETGYIDTGPEMQGQYSILINVARAHVFCESGNGMVPVFKESTLEFLGEKIEFSGLLESNAMCLLINNINSIVSKKDFYQSRGDNIKYDAEIARYTLGKVNSWSEDVFKSIRAKIENNKQLSGVLVLVQKDGFGVFIDQNQLAASHHRT